MTSALEAINNSSIKPTLMVGISSAIATSGREWGDLPASEKTNENALKIARAAVGKEDLFLDAVDGKKIAEPYNNILIQRAADKDKADGVSEGTHIAGYLTDVAAALDKHGFDRAKYDEIRKSIKASPVEGLMALGKLSAQDREKFKLVSADIAKAAEKHIGVADLETDLTETIKAEAAKGAAAKAAVAVEPEKAAAAVAPAKEKPKGGAFDEVDVQAKPQLPEFFQMIIMLFSMLFGDKKDSGRAKTNEVVVEHKDHVVVDGRVAGIVDKPITIESLKAGPKDLSAFLNNPQNQNISNVPTSVLPQSGVVPDAAQHVVITTGNGVTRR